MWSGKNLRAAGRSEILQELRVWAQAFSSGILFYTLEVFLPQTFSPPKGRQEGASSPLSDASEAWRDFSLQTPSGDSWLLLKLNAELSGSSPSTERYLCCFPFP